MKKNTISSIYIGFILTILLSCFLLSCKETKISIKTNINNAMYVGDYYDLIILDDLTNNHLDYEASLNKEGIVEIDNGVVKALKEGTVTITIKVEDFEKEVEVVVSNKEITTNIKEEMVVGDIYTLSVLFNNENIEYNYSLDKEDIVSINTTANGYEIEALKEGTVNVLISGTGFLNEYEVIVKEKVIELEDYTINLPESMELDSIINVNIATQPQTITMTKYEVTCSDNIEITKDGFNLAIKAKELGTAYVIVNINEKIKRYSLEVLPKQILPTKLTVNIPQKIIMSKEYDYTYAILPSNSTFTEVINDADNSFSFNNGKVTANKEGIYEIKFSIKGTDIYTLINIEVFVDNDFIAQQILDYALDSVGEYGMDEVILPLEHPLYGGEIEFISADNELFDTESGFLGFPDFDEEVNVTCNVKYKDVNLSKEFVFTVGGYEMDKLSKRFLQPIRVFISSDISLITHFDDFSGTDITWYSSNEKILTNSGECIKPINDTYVTITYTINTTSPQKSKTFTKEVLVKGCNLLEKCEIIQEWIYSKVCVNKYILSNTVLPTENKECEVYLEWLCTDGEKLDINNLPANFITSGGSYINVKVTNYSGESRILNMYCRFEGKEFGSMWEKIELFLNTIYQERITNQKFNLFGFESGYSVVESQNIGYIPFIDGSSTTRIQEIVPLSKYWSRSNETRTSTEYIVVHNTGCAAPTKTAKVLSDYINTFDISEGYKSWHFTVDDKEIYQQLPIDEVGWHAGDGSTTYPNTWSGGLGGGNRNGVGIETCCYKGIDFNDAMRNLAKLVAELLLQYNLGYDRIKQHYDFSGKNCPQVIRESRRWDELIRLVQLECFMKTQLKGVELTYKSLTPEVLDDHGRVINHLGEDTEVKYEVTVKYNNEVKTFKFTSYLDQLR